MEARRISTPGCLLYLVYGVLVTAVLLWVRFPATKAEAYLSAKVSTLVPGTRMDANACNYGFPAHLLCDRLTIIREQDGEELLRLDNVKIQPSVTRPMLRYRLAGNGYGGTFGFTLTIAPLDGKVMLEEVEVMKAGLDRIPMVKDLIQREVVGALDFHGSWSGSLQGPGEGSLQ